MEHLSNIMANYLVRKKIINVEKSCIYQYGLQIGLEVCVNTVFSVLIAVLCNMELEAIVFLIVFSLFRAYAGGLHLDTYISCLIGSCASFWGVLLLIKHLHISAGLSLNIISLSLVCIKLLAPVKDINRPLNKDEEKRFSIKLNRTMGVIAAISVVMAICCMDRLLATVAMATIFTVIVLILGRLKNRIRKKVNIMSC